MDKTIINQIKQIIINSKRGTEFGKKVMYYLLDNSDNLENPVGIAFNPPPKNKTGGKGGHGREAIFSIHDIRLGNQNEKPNYINFFYSGYDEARQGKMFCWLSKKDISPDADMKILKVNWKKIHAIKLEI